MVNWCLRVESKVRSRRLGERWYCRERERAEGEMW